MKRYAILCSGGDSQGMNICIKAFVNTCNSHGIIPIGIKRGYQGLIDNDMIFLDEHIVENIQCLGGTILKVSRSEEFRTPTGLDKAIRNLKKNEIDGLVVIGGNGSYNGAVNLYAKGVKLIAIPGTIDNDLYYTERTLGFDTAVNNAIANIDAMMQTMEANSRGMIVKVMGRDCGDIALYTAVGCMANSLATAELGTTIEDIVRDVKTCLDNGVTSPLVVVSENCDYELKDVERALRQSLKIYTRSTELGYIQRGGAPSIFDRMLGMNMGIMAVECLEAGVSGVALGIRNNDLFYTPIDTCLSARREFDRDLYNKLRKMHNLDR